MVKYVCLLRPFLERDIAQINVTNSFLTDTCASCAKKKKNLHKKREEIKAWQK